MLVSKPNSFLPLSVHHKNRPRGQGVNEAKVIFYIATYKGCLFYIIYCLKLKSFLYSQKLSLKNHDHCSTNNLSFLLGFFFLFIFICFWSRKKQQVATSLHSMFCFSLWSMNNVFTLYHIQDQNVICYRHSALKSSLSYNYSNTWAWQILPKTNKLQLLL